MGNLFLLTREFTTYGDKYCNPQLGTNDVTSLLYEVCKLSNKTGSGAFDLVMLGMWDLSLGELFSRLY